MFNLHFNYAYSHRSINLTFKIRLSQISRYTKILARIFLFILLFIKPSILFFALFVSLHILLLFLFFYHIYALVLLLLYHLYLYSFALSTERT